MIKFDKNRTLKADDIVHFDPETEVIYITDANGMRILFHDSDDKFSWRHGEHAFMNMILFIGNFLNLEFTRLPKSTGFALKLSEAREPKPPQTV